MESKGSECARKRGERADRQRVGQKSVSRRENSSVQSEGYCRLRGVRAGCIQQWYWTRIPLPDQACSATEWCRPLNITKIYMVSFVGQAPHFICESSKSSAAKRHGFDESRHAMQERKNTGSIYLYARVSWKSIRTLSSQIISMRDSNIPSLHYLFQRDAFRSREYFSWSGIRIIIIIGRNVYLKKINLGS